MNFRFARERCEAWEKMHRDYFPDYAERWQRGIEFIQASTSRVSTPHILDLGCGPGTLTLRLKQAIPRACVTGIEADAALVALAMLNAPPDRAPNFHAARLGAIEASELLSSLAPLDVIVSSAFMHYFDAIELKSLHGELARLLKPTGMIITLEQFANVEAPADTTVSMPGSWEQWWATSRVALPALFAPVTDMDGEREEPPPLTFEAYCAALAASGLTVTSVESVGESTIVAARVDHEPLHLRHAPQVQRPHAPGIVTAGTPQAGSRAADYSASLPAGESSMPA